MRRALEMASRGKSQTRERILRVAEAVFAEKGFSGARVDEIAYRAAAATAEDRGDGSNAVLPQERYSVPAHGSQLPSGSGEGPSARGYGDRRIRAVHEGSLLRHDAAGAVRREVGGWAVKPANRVAGWMVNVVVCHHRPLLRPGDGPDGDAHGRRRAPGRNRGFVGRPLAEPDQPGRKRMPGDVLSRGSRSRRGSTIRFADETAAIEAGLPGVFPPVAAGSPARLPGNRSGASPYALAVIAVLLVVTFRSVPAAPVTPLDLGVGLVWMFGVASRTGIELNFAGLVVVPLIVGMGTDYSVHLIHRTRAEGSLDTAFL